ncbi:hypothetical protein F2Q69_00041520 [Brassica cretica]|uniref:Uncharacterized protein n=1 Tax=Brassica cretica TaxID=69181 RepID=A0A8S9NGW9_BRACR|nr:hypothetical protein F2Q69_00041520 [Brassica cretica]
MQFVVDFSPVSLSGGYRSGAVICQIFVVAGPSGLSGGALSLVWFFWRPLAWLMTRTCVLSKGVSVLGSLRRPFFSHHQCEIVVVGVDFGSLTSDSVVVVSCYRRFFGVGGCGLFLWLEGDYVRPMSMSEILFLVGSPVLGGCPCVGPRCCRPGLTLSVAAWVVITAASRVRLLGFNPFGASFFHCAGSGGCGGFIIHLPLRIRVAL